MKMGFLYISITMVTLVLYSQSIQTMDKQTINNPDQQNTEERNPHGYGRKGEIAYQHCVNVNNLSNAAREQLERNAKPVVPQNDISSASNNCNNTFNRSPKK